MSTKALTKPVIVVETAATEDGDDTKSFFLNSFWHELELRRKKLRPGVWTLPKEAEKN